MMNNTNEYLDALSKRLYEIANKNDWSLSTLSKRSGLSYRELHDVMHGKKNDIRLSTLSTISQNLEEPIPSLIGIVRNPFEQYNKALLKLNAEMSIVLKRGDLI